MIAAVLGLMAIAGGGAPLPPAGSLPDVPVEKQLVLSISSEDLDGAMLSEITWDNGALLLQGVIASSDGSLSGRYAIVPAKGTTLGRLKEQTDRSVAYWELKSKRVSPTGVGRIQTQSDSKLPIYGVGNLERRIGDAVDAGGVQRKQIMRLGRLVIHERDDGIEPYDGEIWSWSPAELNRIAYVDGKGDLWVATADGRDAQRLLKGHFTLPAWSDDGRAIAVAEKKGTGRRWDLFVVLLPAELRAAPK